MKTLIINVSNDAFKELRSALLTRGVTGGLFGLLDEFAHDVIKAMEDKVKEVSLDLKKNSGQGDF